MRYKLSYFIFLFLLISFNTSFAEIKEINEMVEIEKEITDGTLVVFDIDNTLIEGIETLASDSWYDYYLDNLIKKGMDKTTAIKKSNSLWFKIQKAAQVRPVETNTPLLIKKLQSKGFKVMCLTARPSESIEITKRQLKSADIDLSKNPVFNKTMMFKLNSKVEYKDGILYIDESNKKGETLSVFLKKINYIPKKIVFADDKRKHTENMEIEMGKLNIPYIGYQYKKTYERTKQLNFRLSDIQLKYLEKIISDKDAKILLEKESH